MSEDDLDSLRQVYAAWARGDFHVGAELFDPDIEFVVNPDWPDPGVYRGVREMRRAWGDYLRNWEDWRGEAQEFICAGERVFVAVRLRALGRDSRVPVDTPGFNVWTIRGGKAVRLALHLDREQALRDAGVESNHDSSSTRAG